MFFLDDFNDISLSAYTVYAVSGYGVSRYWYTENGLLKPQDSVSEQPGFIISDTQPQLNHSLSATFMEMDDYHGYNSSIILRFMDVNHFHGIKISVGTIANTNRGMYFSTNNTDPWIAPSYSSAAGDVKLELYEPNGSLLSANTELPSSGTIICNITSGYKFDIEWQDLSGNMIVSATHTDDTYLNSGVGNVGFFYADRWYSHIKGWDSFYYTSGTSGIAAPSVIYMSAAENIINSGTTLDYWWSVNPGTESTTVEIYKIDDFGSGTSGVAISGNTTSPPLVYNSEFLLSAWNIVGSVSASFDVFVETSAAPLILTFSGDTPISAGGNSTLVWETSACLSGFIDNGVGWVSSATISADSYEVSGLSATTLYTFSGFDISGHYNTLSYNIVVNEAPDISLFSGTPNPACSGSDYTLVWEITSATSAYIDNGVGWVDTSALSIGTYITSSDLPVNYYMSAWNVDNVISTSTHIQQINYRAPIADAGTDYQLSATDVSGVSVTFNASGSYDLDGQSEFYYSWVSGGNVVSTSSSFVEILSGGVHEFTLTVSDECGLSGSDITSATIISMIPPTAVAEVDPQYVNTSATFILDGSTSTDPDGSISAYSWDLSGSFLSASISAVTSQNVNGVYDYTLTVTDTSGLSASDNIEIYVGGGYVPSANAGSDQLLSLSASTIDIYLSGGGSLHPTLGDFQIVWYEWNLSGFGVDSISGSVSDLNDISATVSGISAAGNYYIPLSVSASNNIIDIDTVYIEVYDPITASAGDDITHKLECSGSFYDVTLSGNSNNTSAVYKWWFNERESYEFGQVIAKEFSVGVHSASLETYTTGVGGEIRYRSELDDIIITIQSSDLKLGTFEFTPNFINNNSATAWSELSWVTTSATSAYIDNSVGWLDSSAVSAGSLNVSGVNDLTYTISAYNNSGCFLTSSTSVVINIGPISAVQVKTSYIKLYGTEDIRYGNDREINLVEMLPDYLNGGDTEYLVSAYQEYLNEMYDGINSYTLGTSSIDITTCQNSISSTPEVSLTGAPTIVTFSATDNIINSTNFSYTRWSILSGSASTSAEFIIYYSYQPPGHYGGIGLSGYIGVPIDQNSTFFISAGNSYGIVSASFDVFANTTAAPLILSFSGNTPVVIGESVTIDWETSACLSAYIDNDIGWVDTSALSAGSHTIPNGIGQTTYYTMSGFDVSGHYNTRRFGVTTSATIDSGSPLSACLLSAVDNSYLHNTYISGGSLSANDIRTPGDDVKKLFIDNACVKPKDGISVLEKTYRLTELFDPDLIPIELIQFYASNLGYEVGLSRENVGFSYVNSAGDPEEIINQKKYLRFMIRNLPTWYKIKTTRNSIKMMLYSFGLIGDFIYYFTKNYMDPDTGIGINTLEYGGQEVNNYGRGYENEDFNHFTVTKDMNYKEVHELRCNAALWKEFKNNKKLYFDMLKDIQAGVNNDWILTDVDLTSTIENITNIPDDYFSTPHFRLWFDILASMENGNFSTDIHKQKLISEAIKVIKPINTVFEGITGIMQTTNTIYMTSYVRIRKHITLLSDGYADYWA